MIQRKKQNKLSLLNLNLVKIEEKNSIFKIKYMLSEEAKRNLHLITPRFQICKMKINIYLFGIIVLNWFLLVFGLVHKWDRIQSGFMVV